MTGAMRYRVARPRVPKLLYVLSARLGVAVDRRGRTLRLFAHDDRRRVLWLREDDRGRVLGALGTTGEVELPPAIDVEGLLATAAYRRVPDAFLTAESEVYRPTGGATVAIEHAEPFGWFCVIDGPAEQIASLAAALELAPSDRETRDDAALLAERLPPPLAGAGSIWPNAFGGALAAVLAALVIGLNATVVLLVAIVAAIGVARALGLADGGVSSRPDGNVDVPDRAAR